MARACLVLFLLVSSVFSAYGDLIINCGGPDISTDENSIEWTGDSSFMGNIGEPQVVQTTRGVSTAMTTLRVFTSRAKNCYTIDSFTQGERVLVRASFYYGNYDKKSAPPTFDLLFEGNHWVTVQTSIDQVVYAEVSYVIMSAVTSICLAQTEPNQFPFISALELRDLETGMYDQLGSSYALLSKLRVAYGANQTIRYEDDVYDRMWNPASIGSSLSVIRNDADTALIDVRTVPDNPPHAVFERAVTTSSTAESITLSSNFPAGETPIYVNMYFSEMIQLETTQERSFQVYIDGNPVGIDPIVPVYESVVELQIFNITATTNTTFSLEATTGSNLPPLINAMEVFYVSGPLADGTNSKDVDGLGALQTEFTGTLDQWSGDPCLPSPYSWEWINCTSDPVPRVTSLNLGSFGLSGLLPDFSSMDSLEIIDLHDNKISGPLPNFLGAFPNLKVLNLANNDFSGPIPASISKNKMLKLQVSGNSQLCDTGESCPTTTDTTVVSSPTGGGIGIRGGKKKSKTPVIVGTIVPSVLIFWAIVGFFIVSHNKRKRAAITSAGNTGGASGPNGTPQEHGRQTHNSFMGKNGEAVVEIKVDIQDEVKAQQDNNTTSSNS